MANVLFTWELGGGLAHVAEMLPLVAGLSGAGHRVFVALRDFSRVARFFTEAGAECLPAPDVPPSARGAVGPPGSFTYVLAEAGFSNPAELQVLTREWSDLLDSVSPELIVFDHSPAALLAARGRRVKRVLLGNGFCCPADCRPLPDLRSRTSSASGQLHVAEQLVLDCANQVLGARRAELLTHVGKLYGTNDEVLLTTFAEFDPYRDSRSALTPNGSTADRDHDYMAPGMAAGGARRGEIKYRGPWLLSGGGPPTWPTGSGKRVYAYLGPSPDLPRLLELLTRSGCRLVISCGRHDARFQRHFARPNVRFANGFLDLARVAAECDVAVLNGNHATTLGMLLAGKPVLQVPLFVEQGLNARATVELGAGLSTFPRGVSLVREQLAELLESPKYSAAARRFAMKHSGFSREAEIEESICRLQNLLASPS